MAAAGPADTRDALDRLDELIYLRMEDGRMSRDDVVPAILVSTRPRYEASASWYTNGVIETLERGFGSGTLRLCEACMVPRVNAVEGALVYQSGPISLDEVQRLDEATRGTAQPARSAIWVDEQPGGVSVRIVDLRTGRVLMAQNVDPNLVEVRNTGRTYTLAAEYERRARGNSLTQAFVDIGVYPQQHVSLDWTDQWGKTNGQMTGLTLSMVDPVLGVGACHYTRLPFLNTLVGAKVAVSIPTSLARSLSDDNIEILDPLLTVAGVVRVPFGRSNYGAIATLSTNGRLALGISLMNITLVPVIP